MSVRVISQKIVFGGNCLTKINGKNTFFPFSLPGETCEIEIVDEKRDYNTARIKNIISPSPYRIKPLCPYYEKCGGCDMMHIDSEYQKKLRLDIFKEAFARCGIFLENVEIVSGENFNYRSRFKFFNGCLFEKETNNSVFVEKCLVAENVINEWLEKTKTEQRPKGKVHIFGSKKMVGEKKIVIANESENSRRHYEGTIINEENTATVQILGKKVTFDVRGFFQSNMNVLEMAIEKITAGFDAFIGLNGKNALDLYSGCGTFSVFLEDYFENLTLVEHNRDALVFASGNLKQSHELIGLKAEKFAEMQMSHPKKFDACVVDPPRSGIEKKTLDYLCASKIPILRYISCNPTTQSRDVKKLTESGYKIKNAYLFDFYPNTHHIESLVSMEL